MVLKLNHKIIGNITLVILFISYMSKYYDTFIPYFGKVLYVIFSAWGICFFTKFHKLKKSNILHLILCFIPAIYSNSTEGLRYTLLLLTLFTWSSFKTEKIVILVKSLIIMGVLESFSQIAAHDTRICGFMTDSPPQFACVMLICMVFMLVYIFNKDISKNWIYVLLSILLIFLSGTRSILAGALLATAYFIVLVTIQKNRFSHKKLLFSCVLLTGIVLIAFASSSLNDVLNSKMGRSRELLDASTSTRFGLWSIILDEVINSPRMILFGNGSGYVEEAIKSALSWSSYLPVHQDFILILGDLGLMGFIFIYYLLLRKHKASLIFLYMFLFCSFHNIMLSIRSMTFMYIIMCNIEQNNYNIYPYNVRKS